MEAGIWQGGDGVRYVMNAMLMHQACAALAAIDAKNKFSKVELTGTAGVFKKEFKHVSFNRAEAAKYQAQATAGYYRDLWLVFQSPASNRGAAVVQQLSHMRRMAQRAQESLAKKFGEVSDVNKESLTSLDGQLSNVQLVRDTGFASVIFLSSGGTGSIASLGMGVRALIAGGAVMTKAGTKVYDINATVTDSAEKHKKLTSVAFGTMMDVLFCGVTLGGPALSMGNNLIIAASMKAPTEGVKTMLDGGSGAQIAFSAGFEIFAPFTEGLGEVFAKKMFPQFAKAATSSLVPLGQHAASQAAAVGKDGWVLPGLAGGGGSSGSAGRFWNLFSMNLLLDMAPEIFYSRYVISRA